MCFKTRLALFALFLWIPNSVHAQECVAGPLGFDPPGAIGLYWSGFGGNTVIPPWGATAEITLHLDPIAGSGNTTCSVFQPRPAIDGGGEWITSIRSWVDSTPRVNTWHWRIHIQGNMSGIPRTATIRVPYTVQGNEQDSLVYVISQDPSRCTASDFIPMFFMFASDGTPGTAPIQIRVSNSDPVPCNVRIATPYPPGFVGPLYRDNMYGVQVFASSTDLSGTNEVPFPNGVGQVAAGQDRNFTIFLSATPNPTCMTRGTNLFIALNDVKQPRPAALSQERSEVPTGSPAFCYRKVKATPNGKPDQYKPKSMFIGSGVRG